MHHIKKTKMFINVFVYVTHTQLPNSVYDWNLYPKHVVEFAICSDRVQATFTCIFPATKSKFIPATRCEICNTLKAF